MASFASSATTGGARKHVWTKILIGSVMQRIKNMSIYNGQLDMSQSENESLDLDELIGGGMNLGN